MNVCIVLPRGDDQTSVSVCVRGGGHQTGRVWTIPLQRCFLSTTLFFTPCWYIATRTSTHQATSICSNHASYESLFWAQHILTFTEKNLCQIIWFAPFFKFYKPPLCGGTPNLCFCISTTAEEPKSLKCTWNKTCIYFPLNISGCKTQTIQRPCELS